MMSCQTKRTYFKLIYPPLSTSNIKLAWMSMDTLPVLELCRAEPDPRTVVHLVPDSATTGVLKGVWPRPFPIAPISTQRIIKVQQDPNAVFPFKLLKLLQIQEQKSSSENMKTFTHLESSTLFFILFYCISRTAALPQEAPQFIPGSVSAITLDAANKAALRAAQLNGEQQKELLSAADEGLIPFGIDQINPVSLHCFYSIKFVAFSPTKLTLLAS